MNNRRSFGSKLIILLAMSVLIISIFCTGAAFAENGNISGGTDKDKNISIIFTHDMHSHMDADKTEKNGEIVLTGGFGRLKTAMNTIREKYPDSFIFDAGDFSMGTPYQTVFSTEASEMKMMKFMGYEATTLGNHEFDYRATGLADMLDSAAGQGVPVLCANIDWKKTLADKSLRENAEILKAACDSYGVKDYMVIDHQGVKVAVFGIIGLEAADYAPESGLLFKDPVKTAGKVVEGIKKNEDVDAIVCLSHSGTTDEETDVMEETEDYMLAEEVPDIDVIISGHSHTSLPEEITVGNTAIVSCGSYNENLGHIVIGKGGKRYKTQKYEIIKLDDTIEPDAGVEAQLKKYKSLMDKEYFNDYGYSISQVLAQNDISFTPIVELGKKQGEEPLGDLLADSYKYAVAKAENGSIKGYIDGGTAAGETVSDEGGAQVTVIPAGVIRGSFFKGDVTVADAFNALSLGYGKDGRAGYPLVKFFLTGKELKAAAEVDASVSEFMVVARLYSSGMVYSWNPNRLILNRAVDVKYNDGKTVSNVEDDRLYSVVADLYSCQMLGSVKEKSFGLLEIDPKDVEGNIITDYEDNIVYDEKGQEVKAWYALASYIDSFGDNQIPEYYGENHNRKVEIDSLNPVELLKQPNRVMAIVATAVVILLLIVVAIVLLVRKIRRRRRSRP